MPAKPAHGTKRHREAVKIIANLTPYPGNEFSNEQTNYVIPDVYVYKIDGEFVIQLNNDGLPKLQISDEYQKLIQREKLLNTESQGYLRGKQTQCRMVYQIHPATAANHL